MADENIVPTPEPAPMLPTKEEWHELAGEILEILKHSAKEYVDKQGVVDFLKDTSQRYAKWKWLAVRETNPVKKAEYEKNLEYVVLQVDIEVTRHAIVASKEAISILTKIVTAAGQFLLKLGPRLLGIPIP